MLDIIDDDRNKTGGQTSPARASLLWPAGRHYEREANLTRAAGRDLDLAFLVRAFDLDRSRQDMILNVLEALHRDPEVILYRQAVLTDLLSFPQLAARLERLLPVTEALGQYSFQPPKKMNALHEVTWRLGELQSILDSVRLLAEAFEEVGEQLKSQGLRDLWSQVQSFQQDPDFQALAGDLPQLLSQLRTCASVTIGVNLDQFLRPVQATLLAVNEEKFTAPSFLNRLVGKGFNDWEGIAQLHSVPRQETGGQYSFPVDPELGWAVDPLMVPLFKDLAEVIEKTTRPIAKQLQRYVQMNGRLFIELRQALVFYLGALRFIRRMQAHGLPMVRPEIAPIEERILSVREMYNPSLVLHLSRGDDGCDLSNEIVSNELEMGENGRILILTGPNQGGKTTYLQAAGLIQVLAQAGLYIPAVQARISPVDNIFTHFPLEEKPEMDAGRLGEESRRLGEIFQHVTRYSLVLLNESLSSTSAGESLYLALDVVRILRKIGLRAIFTTHLHELAARTGEINESTPGDSAAVSLVVSPVEEGPQRGKDIRRSYKVELRPPAGQSYAREIAARYGISYEQLHELLAKRGVIQ